MKIIHYLLLGFIILSISGCGKKSIGVPTSSSLESKYSEIRSLKPYEFQPGDVFDVKFYELPELDQTIIIRPDGRISLPLVEDLLVIGMTPSELDKIITDKYKSKFKDPEVTLILKEFAGLKVYVGGEVNNQGSLQLSGQMTLLQSIFNAGGYKRTAELKNVVLIRKNGNKPEIHIVNVYDIINEGSSDIFLKAYDVVFVPKTFIAEAGDFVDLYINQIIPDMVRFGLNFVYALNPGDVRNVVISTDN